MLILKALHIIAVVCWFAGLFYMPRLFVYHANATSEETKATLTTMEHKLLTYITTPAMVLTWFFGVAMIVENPYLMQGSGWLHAKLTIVVLLTVFHFSLYKFKKDFAHNNNTKSHKFFRIYNEIPTIALVIIVFLAVVKPF